MFCSGGGVPGADAHIHPSLGGSKKKKKEDLTSTTIIHGTRQCADARKLHPSKMRLSKKEPYDKGGPGRSYDKDFSFFTAVGIKWDTILFFSILSVVVVLVKLDTFLLLLLPIFFQRSATHMCT